MQTGRSGPPAAEQETYGELVYVKQYYIHEGHVYCARRDLKGNLACTSYRQRRAYREYIIIQESIDLHATSCYRSCLLIIIYIDRHTLPFGVFYIRIIIARAIIIKMCINNYND